MTPRAGTENPFAAALAVANAVLYEGYLLYPYTASAAKNRIRWQFGVVVPEAYAAAGNGEPCEQQTDVLLDGSDAVVTVLLRFLQVEARRVEIVQADGSFAPVAEAAIAGRRYVSFDEGVERELSAAIPAAAGTLRIPLAVCGGSDVEVLRDGDGTLRGRIVRERWALHGELTLTRDTAGPYTLVRVQVRNRSAVVAGERSSALRTALVSTHVLLAAEGGRFLSTLDPPADAVAEAAALQQKHAWPVLVGDPGDDPLRAPLVLASPIILYDFPEVAAQTSHDAFDGTEIDELLTLSVLSLSDDERDEARATDPRARAIVERAERFGAQDVARLHGGALVRGGDDPFAAIDVRAIDCFFVDGVKVTRGMHVRLRPNRRADVWDTFLAGKTATVRKIHQDLEGNMYAAVTVDDDPASDLHEWYGRSLFFSPDEIDVLPAAEPPR
ncbi:hypothetical protein WPS_17910 [Vulcanimicrobium alpinum]|uniref:Uncharacterized protein n=1 Tax=Vulcanimicrobium alpinum TaxID=3016050 RepID=A0AAN1XW53_UNVUL|nr:hypothetical protein [Vulcanimicrobium alpinum]BDE06515.1 hypothetical protein WPS_17910 [Vulcanimicrobium alpinum]